MKRRRSSTNKKSNECATTISAGELGEEGQLKQWRMPLKTISQPEASNSKKITDYYRPEMTPEMSKNAIDSDASSSSDDEPIMQIRNRKYKLLCRFEKTKQWKQQFAEICRQNNLAINELAGNNNRECVPLRCSQEELCPYSGLFLPQELAIYVRMGMEHNHSTTNAEVMVEEGNANKYEEIQTKNNETPAKKSIKKGLRRRKQIALSLLGDDETGEEIDGDEATQIYTGDNDYENAKDDADEKKHSKLSNHEKRRATGLPKFDTPKQPEPGRKCRKSWENKAFSEKQWHFLSQFNGEINGTDRKGGEEELRYFFRQNYLYRYRERKSDNTIYLACKNAWLPATKRETTLCCPFRGKFIKATRAYASGEHNHPLVVNDYDGFRLRQLDPDSKPSPFYVDRHGKKWKFIAQLDAKIADYENLQSDERKQLQRFYHQYLLTCWIKKDGNVISLVCKRGNFGKNKPPHCPVRGKMFKTDGALYMIGEHNHPVQPYMKVGEDDDGIYIDRHGKCWRLIGKANTANELEIFRKEQWLHCNRVGKPTINFDCKIANNASKNGRSKCPFRVTCVRETGCLYAYGEHNHPLANECEKDGIYIDYHGKCWRLIGKVKDKNEFSDYCKEQGLHKDGGKGKETINAGCLRRRRGKCVYRLILIMKTGFLYAYGEHNHPVARKAIKIERENDPTEQQQNGILSFYMEPRCSIDESTERRKQIRQCNRKQITGTVVGSSRAMCNSSEESDEEEEDGDEESDDEEAAMEEDEEDFSTEEDDDFDEDF